MMVTSVTKKQFEPNALGYVHDVLKTGNELVVTENGKPILKIVPFLEDPSKILESLRDSIIRYDDPFEPVGLEDWETLK